MVQKGYIAPEIYIRNQYNNKIDVFSCGVVLYSMITERFPFPKAEELPVKDILELLLRNEESCSMLLANRKGHNNC